MNDHALADIIIGEQVPKRNSFTLRAIGRISARLFGGWQAVGEIPNYPKMIVVIGPHTSNWDYPIAMSVVLKLGLKISYFGKDSLFKPPFGKLFTLLGGIPVKRDEAQGVVEQTRLVFKERDQLLLAMAPEGTRSRVSKLRTGFQQIARASDVPILLVAFDYKNKHLVFSHTFKASDDQSADINKVVTFFDAYPCKKPENWGCKVE